MSSQIDPRGKVFRDPIHNLIRIDQGDEVLLDLMESREFQRLRRVRQLGVSWLTYPGAEHTRFTHSLGVLNFTQRILYALERRYGRCTEISTLRDHQREVKAAALLHDIGHGPFSHMVERAFGRKTDHAERTTELIGSPKTEVHQVLVNHGLRPDDVKAIIDKASDFPFLQDIVSSQLDADRMDYILRDAYNTGVRYGTFDAEWIVNSLCLGLDPAAPVGAGGVRHLRLCLDSSRGLHSAEQLIIARYHMSMQVYFHRTTRGWEAHLLMLLNEARRLGEKLPQETPGVVRQFIASGGELSEADFLRLDDAMMTAAFSGWSEAASSEYRLLSRLATCFLRRQKLLKRQELTPEQSRPDRRLLLRSRLEAHAGPQGRSWILDDINFGLYKFFGPLTGRSATSEHEAILLSSGELSERAQPFEITSLLFSALGAKREAGIDAARSAACRLYFLPDVADAVKQAFIEADDPLMELRS